MPEKLSVNISIRRRLLKTPCTPLYLCFQAIPVANSEVSSADEAQAAKRRRLPSGSNSPSVSSMETTTKPACPLTTALVTSPAAEQYSISPPTTSQPLPQATASPQETPTPTGRIQMTTETPMDISVTLSDTPSTSTAASDPMLTPQSTSFQSMLNSDPLLSSPSPPPPPQHMSDSYMPSNGYVSYMETLLNSHFPQDDDPRPMY